MNFVLSALKHQLSRIVAVILVLLVAAGCRQSQQPTSSDLQLTLDSSTPFQSGKTTLIVTLSDAQGSPLDNAKIEVTGDMTHAGMVPSLGTVETSTQGRYSIPFEWTMGGDWIVTIKATLPDGRTTSKRFEVTVKTP
jgi:YtkA-like